MKYISATHTLCPTCSHSCGISSSAVFWGPMAFASSTHPSMITCEASAQSQKMHTQMHDALHWLHPSWLQPGSCQQIMDLLPSKNAYSAGTSMNLIKSNRIESICIEESNIHSILTHWSCHLSLTSHPDGYPGPNNHHGHTIMKYKIQTTLIVN